MYTADHARAQATAPRVSSLAALVASTLLAFCAPAGTSEPPSVSVTDDAGHTVALSAPARRVFSVVPSLTESVAALDPGVLVARTRYDQAPELAHLPSLGDTVQPNLEALARLAPDLVITWADVSQRAIGERVDALGIPVYRAKVQAIADTRSHLRRLGTLLGRAERAAALVESLDLALENVAAAVQGREPVDVSTPSGTTRPRRRAPDPSSTR